MKSRGSLGLGKGFHGRLLFLFAVAAFLFILTSCGAKSTDANDQSIFPGKTSLPVLTQPADTQTPTETPFNIGDVGTQLPGTELPTAELNATPQPESTAPVFPTDAPEVTQTMNPDNEAEFDAFFLGVKGYGHINAAAVQAAGAKVYRFLVGSEEKLFSIKNIDDFSIQNRLMEGYSYHVAAKNGEIISVRLTSSIEPYSPVISGTPGKQTLKNFLKTAFMPLGTTLYVYGGGWDWQDVGSSVQSTSIGVSGTWESFFRSQNADYLYKDSQHPETSYYPFGKWNEYYYAGLDCSGYVGWVMYNTLETASGQSGYVMKSSKMAKSFASEYALGSWSSASFENDIRPGDIVSMSDHVWVCVGRCSDGSIVIIHSSPSKSVTEHKGGGVQLSALNPNGDSKDCEAYRLASYYQNKYYPVWASRYPVVMKSYEKFVRFARSGSTGVFRWDLSGAMTDPDGYASLSAAEVLADLFGE